MGQQALFDPVMIKKWGNCEPKSGCFRGHFPLRFFDPMTAFVRGFSIEGDVLICQDLTKPNPVYLSCRVAAAAFQVDELAHLRCSVLSTYNESVKEERPMKKRKFKIYLTPAENSIVIQSLNHLRNTMLRENQDTGCLDELLLKAMCAPVKKM